MSDPSKLIEQFLEKNGLLDTLKAFRQESKRTLSNQKAPVSIANIHKLILPTDEESQNKLREHLQKADPKYLKRFLERVKKMPKDLIEDTAQPKLKEQKFFQKLVEK